MKTSVFKRQSGFALLEALLIIAILAILAGIIIIAVNPGKQLEDTRNSQRQADITTILNAVHQYSLDNDEALPADITETATEICAATSTNCNKLVDLSVVIAGEKYITSIPKDPQCNTICAPNGTGYKISKNSNGRVTVSAPAAEGGRSISATR